MILPGLFPAQVRSRPIVRGVVPYNNARVSSTVMRFNKADIPAFPGDMVVFDCLFRASNVTTWSSNFGLVPAPTGNLRGYKLWDGSEPSTLEITAPGASIQIGSYVIHVITGVTRLVAMNSESTSSSAVLVLSDPARFWIVASQTGSGSTQIATPPSGYTGYTQATTTAGDNAGIRTAYRIDDENTQLAGSWSNLPSQLFRSSWAFR